MNIKKALVAGSGQMGPGIAYTLASVGCKAKIFGRTVESVDRGMSAYFQILEVLSAEGCLAADRVAPLKALVSGTTELEAEVGGADLVIESIPENLELKREMFQKLDGAAGPEALLASNTSAIRISGIAEGLCHPERVLGTHFWNPPHLMPLVEVVKGEKTSMATVETLSDLLGRAGKKPVKVLKDTPGQLGNRLFQALLREAMYIVEEGIASVEDVDTTIPDTDTLAAIVAAALISVLEDTAVIGMVALLLDLPAWAFLAAGMATFVAIWQKAS